MSQQAAKINNGWPGQTEDDGKTCLSRHVIISVCVLLPSGVCGSNGMASQLNDK